MEPVTHFLTGACLGRAGLNRKTAYATLAAVLAAEAADIDVFWAFAGPVEELKHHRGITHSFWAAPVLAAAVVGAVWVIDRVRPRRPASGHGSPGSPATGHRRWGGMSRAEKDHENSRALTLDEKIREFPSQSLARQPIRWGWLYLTAFIAALTHLLLDWTNNYGLRPFFPFNPRWYAGSFMFIAEPVIWALLFLAFFMPWVLGLADREIGARRAPFHGRGWAVFALAGMIVLGCWRWAEHAHALALLRNAGIASEPVIRDAAEPYPVNLFRWHAILETRDFYQTAEINTLTGSIDSDAHRDVLYKPTITPAVEAARRTLLGRVYLDWGAWAVVRGVGQEPIAGLDPPNLPPGRAWTTVEFTDLRFDYSFLASRSAIPGAGGHAPLSGWVYVDGSEDAGEVLDGRVQH